MAKIVFSCPKKHTHEMERPCGIMGDEKCPQHGLLLKRFEHEPVGEPYENSTVYGKAPAAMNAGMFVTAESDKIQLGREFTSAKDQDAHARATGKICGDEKALKKLEKTPEQRLGNMKESSKKEIYAAIRAADGFVGANGKTYKLNDKNQAVEQP